MYTVSSNFEYGGHKMKTAMAVRDIADTSIMDTRIHTIV